MYAIPLLLAEGIIMSSSSQGEKPIREEKNIPIKELGQCRILLPNEEIKFGNMKLKNVSNKPTTACEILEGFDEQEVLDKVQSEEWYKQYSEYRKEIINDCVKEGKISERKCKSRVYLKDKILIGTESDPFDTQKATHIKTRYIASLMKRLYPQSIDKKGNFINQFHSRNVHYRMLSENLAMPIFKKGEGWQLGNYNGSKKDWENLKEALVEGRNAGLIPFGQMVDRRVPFEIKPPVFKVGKAKGDSFQPKLKLDVKLKDDLKIDLDVPQVIFYSEKSEMGYVLENLAKKYNLAYFLGRGQLSTSNAHKL
jgi:hypothetical protein